MSNQSSIDGVGGSGSSATSPRETRTQSILRCAQSLIHAAQCRDDANCRRSSCIKFKRVVQHTKSCKKKKATVQGTADGSSPCPICKQFIALCCYHAKHCDDANCPVPYCVKIKQKVKHQQLQKRLQQVQIVQRRIASMTSNYMSQAQNCIQSSSGSNNASSTFPQQNQSDMEPAGAVTPQSSNQDVDHSVEPEGFQVVMKSEI